MDLETAKFLLQVLEFLVVGSCSVYVYIANKNRVTNERISEMESSLELKIDSHGERIAHLEAHVEEAPTHDDLATLHEKVNEVGNKMSTIDGKLDGVSSNLRLLMQRVMERGLP